MVLTASLIVAAIVYSKFLFFGHISWDDPEMIFKNKFVKGFNLKELISNHFVGNYIPVTMITHAIAWLLFENNDGGHHLINILFHLMNAILVFKLGKKLFKNDTIANFGAIIFLLHPLQVESVGWISELKNIISTTFYLLGCLHYLNFCESAKKKNYILCFLFFVLGCLSKPSVVVFPVILIILDIFIHKRISAKFILNKIPFLIVAIGFGIINIKTQTADLFINYSHEFPFYQRIGFAGFALLKYLLLFLLPINLSVIYPYPVINLSVFAMGYFAILLIVVLLVLLIIRKNYKVFALVLFVVINLALVLQFIPFGEVLYADRYMYIAIIGLAWILGFLLLKLSLSFKIIPYGIILILGLSSFSRSNVWESGLALYEDILRHFPNSFVALNSAGVENMFLNNDEKALEYMNRAISNSPKNYKGFYNRGLLYLKNNQPEKAINSFNQALKIYQYPKAYVGRASAYYMLSDFPKAINDANFVLKLDITNQKAHFVLGNCYNDLNQLNKALEEYNKCIEIDNNEAEFYFKRAIVYGKKQDFLACVNELNICLKLNPNYYEAYYWRGVAKVNLKQNACTDFKISAQKNYQPAIDAYNKFCR